MKIQNVPRHSPSQEPGLQPHPLPISSTHIPQSASQWAFRKLCPIAFNFSILTAIALVQCHGSLCKWDQSCGSYFWENGHRNATFLHKKVSRFFKAQWEPPSPGATVSKDKNLWFKASWFLMCRGRGSKMIRHQQATYINMTAPMRK